MKTQLFIIAAIFCTLSANAQIHVWSKGLVGAQNTEVYGQRIHVETSGNAIYSYGEHTNIDSPNIFYVDPLGANIPVTGGMSSGYVTKMNPDGQLIWAHSFQSTSWNKVSAVYSDPGGNCYIAGYFLGTMDADPGNGSYNLTSNSGISSFIIKLDATGNFVWSQMYEETVINDLVIRSNAIFCGGNFSGQQDFDCSAATYILTSQDISDCFIMRLNTDGALQWAKGFGSTSNTSDLTECVTSINVTPNGEINVAGVFSEGGDFNPDAGQTLLSSPAQTDVFIMRLGATGVFQWAVNAGSTYGVYSPRIATSSSGTIYQSNSAEVSLSGQPYEDISLRKFSSEGALLWSKHIGGNYTEQASGLTVDEEENLYLSGDLGSESVDFDPGSGETILQCDVMGSFNGYLVKFTPEGNLEWATSLPGNPNSIWDVKYYGGFVYTTGYFFNSLDFAPGEDYHYEIEANPPYPSGFVSKLDVTETLGLANEMAENSTLFKLYPNPAQSTITIQQEQLKTGSTVKIYDLTGALILDQVIQQPTTVLNVQSLASGTYLVELHQDNTIAVQRLIKD